VEKRMIDPDLHAAAQRVIDACSERRLMVATAESCTGGLVVAALTEIPGSSAVVAAGFVTYSNDAKHSMLSVSLETLRQHGAVSRATARAMADGVLAHAPVDLAVAVTGIAGPGGGSLEKPVGLVHFAAAARSGGRSFREERYGEIGRAEVRRRSVQVALAMLEDLASTYAVP
jgi:nicotinamide-nucleotide amidase